jgi:two-component system LytT family response regulator
VQRDHLPEIHRFAGKAPGAARRGRWPRMMDVIIVDDEQAGRRTCANSARRRATSTWSASSATARRRSRPSAAAAPQLLFLDIQMDPLNGIDSGARALALALPSLVFVTAYDAYALEAFEVSAVDYLLKPFDQERFRKTLEPRAAAPRQSGGRAPGIARTLLAQLERGARAVEERPRCSRNSTAICMCSTRITWNDRADRNYVHPRRQGQLSCPQHPEQAEQALRSQPMLRISRSCLVNMNFVKEVNRTLRGDFILVLAGGATVTSSEGFRARSRSTLARCASLAGLKPPQSSSSGANGANHSFSEKRCSAWSPDRYARSSLRPARRSTRRSGHVRRAAAGSCRPR